MARRSSLLPNKVASALLQRILREEFLPGSTLPSERELQEEYGVSRTVVREAMKMLSANEFISTGAGQSATVGTNLTKPTTHALLIAFHRRRVETSDLLYTRMLLEPQIAALAAEHASPLQIRRLQELSRDLEQISEQRFAATQSDNAAPDYLTDVDAQFHITLAQASQNPALDVLVEMLVGILWHQQRLAQVPPSPDRLRLAATQHSQICEAIVARAPEQARQLMVEHLEATHHNLFGVTSSLRDLVHSQFAELA